MESKEARKLGEVADLVRRNGAIGVLFCGRCGIVPAGGNAVAARRLRCRKSKSPTISTSLRGTPSKGRRATSKMPGAGFWEPTSSDITRCSTYSARPEPAKRERCTRESPFVMTASRASGASSRTTSRAPGMRKLPSARWPRYRSAIAAGIGVGLGPGAGCRCPGTAHRLEKASEAFHRECAGIDLATFEGAPHLGVDAAIDGEVLFGLVVEAELAAGRLEGVGFGTVVIEEGTVGVEKENRVSAHGTVTRPFAGRRER